MITTLSHSHAALHSFLLVMHKDDASTGSSSIENVPGDVPLSRAYFFKLLG